MRGAPATAIQELAGHADLTTTMRSMPPPPAARQDAVVLVVVRDESDPVRSPVALDWTQYRIDMSLESGL